MIERIQEAGMYEVIDLDPLLLGASSECFLRDGHWNARGHQVVAGALAEVLNRPAPTI
jgi:hypothetical protein